MMNDELKKEIVLIATILSMVGELRKRDPQTTREELKEWARQGFLMQRLSLDNFNYAMEELTVRLQI